MFQYRAKAHKRESSFLTLHNANISGLWIYYRISFEVLRMSSSLEKVRSLETGWDLRMLRQKIIMHTQKYDSSEG